MKAYSVYFLWILDDLGDQIELPVVFGRKAVRFDEAGVLKGLYWRFLEGCRQGLGLQAASVSREELVVAY